MDLHLGGCDLRWNVDAGGGRDIATLGVEPTALTILDGEVFIVDVDAAARLRTIQRIGVDAFDRRRRTLTMRRVGTLTTKDVIHSLFHCNGRLYVTVYDDDGDTNNPYVTILEVDRETGVTRTAARCDDEPIFFKEDFLVVFADMSVYRRSVDGAVLEPATLADARMRRPRLFVRPPESGGLCAAVSATWKFSMYTACCKDRDGCVIHVDNAGRLRLYGPDLRLARDFGRVPQFDAQSGAAMAGPVDRLFTRIALDDDRGLLYVYGEKRTTIDVNEYEPFVSVFSVFNWM